MAVGEPHADTAKRKSQRASVFCKFLLDTYGRWWTLPQPMLCGC